MLLFSCGGEKEETTDVADVETTVDTVAVQKVDDGTFSGERRLPTPKEFFEIIRQIGGKRQADLLIPAKNADSFTDNRNRALAFGMFSADIAYVSSYEIGSNTLVYLATLEKLANAMDLGGIFDEELKRRIEGNSGNIDSLFVLSDVAFYNAVEYLKMDMAENVLGLMLAGGWIESMFIVSSIAGEFDAQKPIFENMKGQYLVLETIQEYLLPYNDDEMVLQVYGYLSEIRDIYYEAGTKGEGTTVKKDENGRIILSGGKDVILTAESYGKIVERVKEIRGLILANEL